MDITTIIKLWFLSSLFSEVLFLWMTADVIQDYRVTLEEHTEHPEIYGLEHVHIARMNIVREATRLGIGTLFLITGYLAWDRPDWAPPGLTVYLLLAANFGIAIKALLDRHARIALNSHIKKQIVTHPDEDPYK